MVERQHKMTNIILCMIVKNEAHVIERCLESVKPLITHWIISDTGSTDGTQEKIKEYLKDVPGILIETPWKDFGYNRTKVMEEGRSFFKELDHSNSYFLIIDADDTIQINSKEFKLTDDLYDLKIEDGDTIYNRPHLLKLSVPFYFKDVIHEYIDADVTFSSDSLFSLIYKRIGGGSRSNNPEKYLKDVEILKQELLKDPTNSRYMFYLGQSCKDAGLLEEALITFDKRSKMEGWDEETWIALYEAAQLAVTLDFSLSEIFQRYLHIFEVRPTRAEPLYELARFCRLREKFHLAFLFAAAALQVPIPTNDQLFIDIAMYKWKILDEYAISAYWCGFKEISLKSNQKLLDDGFLPENEIARIKDNLQFSL